MGIRVIHVMTHNSIGLGEDGPTHQPVEHLAIAAGDAEPDGISPRRHGRDGGGWDCALRAEASPTVLCLSRQDLPAFRVAAVAGNRSRAAPIGASNRRVIATSP